MKRAPHVSQPPLYIVRETTSLHRNRNRPPGSLRDRLLAMARLARQQADACSDDQAREAFLRKAEQTERTAAIEEWILSPGAIANFW